MKHSTRAMAIAGLVALMLPVSPQAQPGDCNTDGFVNTGDLTYLVSYLFAGGRPPNLVLCDCDGFPGVNYGDFWQLTEFLFMGAALFASPGTDVPVPTNVKFLVLGQPDGLVQTTATVLVDAPVAIDCVILPYSFAAGPGEATLNCTSVREDIVPFV